MKRARRPDLEAMTVDQLIQYFTDTSIAKEEAIFDSTTDEEDPTREAAVKRMQELHSEVEAVAAELRAREPDARLALMPLYDHPNAQVNLDAAHYTLVVAPEQARERLEAIADSTYPPQFIEARSIVAGLKSGNYKPD